MAYRLWTNTKEKIQTVVTTNADPTGASPSWAFTAVTAEPSSWTAGTWSGTYDSTAQTVTAVSPLVGSTSSGAAVELADGTYRVWIKWTVGTETPIRLVGTIIIN